MTPPPRHFFENDPSSGINPKKPKTNAIENTIEKDMVFFLCDTPTRHITPIFQLTLNLPTMQGVLVSKILSTLLGNKEVSNVDV